MKNHALDRDVLTRLILTRVLCDSEMGVGVDAVRRDLKPFVEHMLSPGEWREACEQAVTRLEAEKHIEIGARKILVPRETAQPETEKFLGRELSASPEWVRLQNHELIAVALGIADVPKIHIKALGGVRELRHAILQAGYDLPIKRGQSPAALRNALALKALEKGFGEQFRDLAKGRGSIPGKTGRLIAAQLLGRPKAYADDGALIAQLAAEKAGAIRGSLPSLRTALWQSLVVRKSAPESDFSSDLKVFSELVHTKAKERAKGWPGNRRAYISHVWNSIRADCPELSLNEGHFKSLLAEAHKAGHVNLINADLRSRKNIEDLKASAVNYKNIEWHFIRVEE